MAVPVSVRRGDFGWRSQPAIRSVKEAFSEINKVARYDWVPKLERPEESAVIPLSDEQFRVTTRDGRQAPWPEL